MPEPVRRPADDVPEPEPLPPLDSSYAFAPPPQGAPAAFAPPPDEGPEPPAAQEPPEPPAEEAAYGGSPFVEETAYGDAPPAEEAAYGDSPFVEPKYPAEPDQSPVEEPPRYEIVQPADPYQPSAQPQPQHGTTEPLDSHQPPAGPPPQYEITEPAGSYQPPAAAQPRSGTQESTGSHYPPAGAQPQGRYESAESLRSETLVRGRKSAPVSGWRRVVYKSTLGALHPGESRLEVHRRELVGRAQTQVAGGHHRVAVLSLKGGVGKTTTTVAMGATLASLRGDRVLAVDANPDRGTLSDKVRLETAATIRDLLNEKDLVRRYADIRGFTSQAASRLEVLASDRDPAVSEAFSEADYREVSRLLENHYSICLTDCGTGMLHSAMRGVLGLADQIVLVSSPSVDGARSASATLDWLEAHEYGYLVRGAVVVLSMVRDKGKSSVDLERLEGHFNGRCRSVVRVPWDSHLEEGAEVDLDRLAPATRHSYLQLAATTGEAFAWPR